MRNCPLCGDSVKTWEIFFISGLDKFALNHACHHNADPDHTGFVSVYGATKQEVIDRWNGECIEEQTNESL